MADLSGTSDQRDLPRWFWLWLPLVFLIIIYAGRACCGWKFYERWIMSEHGFVELMTPVMLIPAIICGIRCWKMRARLPHRWLVVWLVLATLGSFYFAGEELSWGQQIFEWKTPGFFQKYNDQDETNIHNMSSWFDQKPRLVLALWVLAGGIILPIRRRITGKRYTAEDWRYWFWPASFTLPVAVLGIVIRFPEHATKWFHAPQLRWDLRYSEVQELYFAYFLCLYLVTTWIRLRDASESVAEK